MDRKTKVLKIVNFLAQEYTDKEIRESLEIPKRTYFRWKRRIDQESLHNVAERKVSGKKPSFEMPVGIRTKILYWRKRYGWGHARIEGHLKVRHDIHVPHNQIYKLIVQHKLNNPIKMPRKYWEKAGLKDCTV